MRTRMAGLALAAGLMATGTASAADYYIVSRDGAVFVAVDLGTVNKAGSVTWARVTRARAEPIQFEGKPIDYSVSLEEFDCEKRLTRTEAPWLFLADDIVVAQYDAPGEWKPIIPQSQADYMLQATCDPASREAARLEYWPTPKDMIANYRQRIAAGTLD